MSAAHAATPAYEPSPMILLARAAYTCHERLYLDQSKRDRSCCWSFRPERRGHMDPEGKLEGMFSSPESLSFGAGTQLTGIVQSETWQGSHFPRGPEPLVDLVGAGDGVCRVGRITCRSPGPCSHAAILYEPSGHQETTIYHCCSLARSSLTACRCGSKGSRNRPHSEPCQTSPHQSE